MSLLKNFLKKLGMSEVETLHQPQEGYKPLFAVKFLRQIVTADSKTSRVIMLARTKRKLFLKAGG